MASAWGTSWGNSWGNSWGASVSPPAPAPQPDGGMVGGGYAAMRRAKQQRDIRARNKELIAAIVSIVTSGALDQ